MPAYSVLEQIEQHKGPLRVTDLARIFDLSRKTIYKMISEGDIPTLQLGTPDAIRIDPKSLLLKLKKDNPILSMAARHG